MPLYIVPKGRPTMAIAVCGRCKLKMPYDDLSSDMNSPGLRVCVKCNDAYDPWRLPARQTEDITLERPRPDEPLKVS